MNEALATVPTRRASLVIRPIGSRGRYVVKDTRTDAFFELGEQEHFLLTQLDGRRRRVEVCNAFAQRFGEPLDGEGLTEFLQLARSWGLLQPPRRPAAAASASTAPPRTACRPPARQSLVFWRKKFLNPDRLFDWLAPRLRFVWSIPFAVLSACAILAAIAILTIERAALATSFAGALRWETIALVWVVAFSTTMLHEFSHGLTCKHFGGQVCEIGFLMIFFMPGMYCNVSDAWLFREKWKRLLVTFAGGYCDLCVWALAVFVWRLSVPDSLVNYVAFGVLSVNGVRSFINFNPLIKLDGYYLLSDALEIPNLQERGLSRLKATVRRLLWGGPPPGPDPNAKVLTTYGLGGFLFRILFLGAMVWGGIRMMGATWGLFFGSALLLFGSLAMISLFRGFSAGEFRKMLRSRRVRTVGWLLLLAALVAALALLRCEDRAAGSFQVRPLTRSELRAPLAGFLKTVEYKQGDRVPAGALVAQVAPPDLESRLAQKLAEVAETQALLAEMQAGARSEELAEQRARVERAVAWHQRATDDLARLGRVHETELLRLEKRIAAHEAEVEAARDSLTRRVDLRERGAVTREQEDEAQRRYRVSQALLEQAQAERLSLLERGTLEAESELARRQKELADERGKLALLEAGTRPEQIEAQRQLLARLQVEQRYLEQQRSRQDLHAPTGGVVVTPHLQEKVGQYLAEGDEICTIEDPRVLLIEIAVPEDDLQGVHVGQAVDLKFRYLPYETFTGRVQRIAPAAEEGAVQGTVTVCCRLENPDGRMRPGMTGYARIYTGSRAIGLLLADGVLRYLRTEFWW